MDLYHNLRQRVLCLISDIQEWLSAYKPEINGNLAATHQVGEDCDRDPIKEANGYGDKLEKKDEKVVCPTKPNGSWLKEEIQLPESLDSAIAIVPSWQAAIMKNQRKGNAILLEQREHHWAHWHPKATYASSGARAAHKWVWTRLFADNF